ncbi:MAG TPA: FAD-dependent monooxygenase [Solirubrobacterales bacterium]|nr:FAD-dependent monooxygenase [Solirubrobacterales bacterium]
MAPGSGIERCPRRTRVLIAGGGPVGLAAAVELGRRGIDNVVIEPRAEVSHARPRCKTVNPRTMEHLRRWGIADRLRERCPLPTSWSQDIVFCTSLTGYEISRFTGVLGLVSDGDRFPELGQQAPQYLFEELLREVVEELDASTMVTGLRVAALRAGSEGAAVTVVSGSGEELEIEADFVLGCDGPRSTVREAIGASYVGEWALRPNFGIVFRSPQLWRQLRHGPAIQYWIVNADAGGLIGPLDREGTWWMGAFGVDAETGERERERIIADVVGRPLDVEVLSTDPWTARMQLVDRARIGPVLLAGDAAHLNPPFGGHGMNIGVGDAVDIGWKLAGVLEGWADPGLLDTYELERRPVQEQVIAEATSNMRVLSSDLLTPGIDSDGPAGAEARRLAHDRIQETKRAEFHALDLVLDLRYESAAISSSSSAAGSLAGARLPHAWLGGGDSIYDELADGFTLLRLGGAGGLESGLVDAAARRGVPLRFVDLTRHGLAERYGTDLLLVRPDQHVAWSREGQGVDESDVIERIRGAAPARPEL